MTAKKICPSCAAEYEDTLPKCPYCGALSYKGAEAEYLKKLEDVRSDLEDLETVPASETKKELAKQGNLIRNVLLIVGGIALVLAALIAWIDREEKIDAKAEYRWKQEMFPVLDQLYEEERYEELLASYWNAAADEMPIWDWDHADFADVLDQCFYAEHLLDQEADGTKLEEYEETYLLYYGFRLIGELEETLSADERERLEPYVERISEDFQNRWTFLQEDLDAIAREKKENYGIVSYQFCEDYVTDRRKNGKTSDTDR